MSGQLVERLIEDINKTGFPLELRVAHRLRTRGYYVATNVYFIDRDEGKGREVDIRALCNAFLKLGTKSGAVRHCLLVECKKSSNRPWVFFTSPTVSYDQDLFETLSHGLSRKWITSPDEAVNFEKRHPWFRLPERGRSFYEAFSGNAETHHAIQRGLMSAIKATIETRKSKFAGDYPDLLNAIFYYPIVVLDGELFTARLSGSRLIVKPATKVAVSVHYRSTQYPDDDRYTVMVVRETALPALLTELDRWLRHCAVHFRNHPECFASPSRRRWKGKSRSTQASSPRLQPTRGLRGARD